MADTWVTDSTLYDAVDRLGRTLLEMAADATGDPSTAPPHSLPRTVLDSLRADATDFMFFDPAQIDAEYGRMLAVAKGIGSDPATAADLEETKNHLINWTGDAATAFKRQVDLMKEYCDLQQLNVLQGMLGLIAAGQLAIRARADYLELVEATIAAAEREIGEQSKRDSLALVSIGSEIVKSVLDLDASRLIGGTVGIFVDIGSELTKRNIEGDDSDVVVSNYCRVRDELREFYRHELDRLRTGLTARIDEVVRAGHPLNEPLPVVCDVESPDFSYEHMQSTRAGEAGPITPVAEQERKRYVDEKTAQDSEIGRRLGGDKGAI